MCGSFIAVLPLGQDHLKISTPGVEGPDFPPGGAPRKGGRGWMVTARIEPHIAPEIQFLLGQQIVEMSWPGVNMVPAVCHPHLFI